MRRINIFLLVIFSIFFQSSWAALSLELTQGQSSAIPIGLKPFKNEDMVQVSGGISFSTVIYHDLINSGEFKIIQPNLLDQFKLQNAVDYKVWQKRGVNDLITGQITSLPGGNYRVKFNLLNIYTPKAPVVLQQSFVTNESGLRGLAHHIADMVYQKLTGVRGIFMTKIAYVVVQNPATSKAHYELVVADADGFAPHVLLSSHQPILSPAWSPDGKSLAYVSFERHKESIYTQELATGHRQLVSSLPGINSAPAFSPDGTKIAMVLTSTGNPKIYVFDRIKYKLTQITHGYSIDTEPAWSLNGKTLIFTSNRGGTPQIYQVSLDGGNVERLTFDGNYNARASFVPLANSIIMMHRSTSNFGIAKQDLQSGAVQVLTNSGSDESPSVAPNGRMIIYATSNGGRGSLAVVSVNGRVKLRLPSRVGNVQEPAWSPFLN